MRTFVGVGFGSAFALSMLTGIGCALTNYSVITDDDNGGQSNSSSDGNGQSNGGDDN